jgi:exosortase E/protease (VPEID-CTERM system)
MNPEASEPQAARAQPRPHWAWPLALLLLEYLWFSMRFDALPLLQSAGLSHLFGHLGILAPLLFVIATATWVVSSRGLRSTLRAALEPPSPRAQAGALAVNLAGFLGLSWLTGQLLVMVQAGVAIAVGWSLAWLALGAITALAILPALTPLSLLPRLLRIGFGALLLGAAAGALAWTAGLLSERLWDSLRGWTLTSVYALLSLFTNDLGYAPEDSALGMNDFVVVVAPECSGIEGIGLILVVISAYLYSARAQLRFPRALVLLPLAVLAVYFGNTLRIAALIGVGAHISPEIALSGFHSKAGWLLFCAIALGLIAWAQRSAWFLREPLDTAGTWSPAATYLAPLLALIATSLVTALFSAGFDRCYGLRIVSVLLALFAVRKHLPVPAWPPSWQGPLLGCIVFGLWIWLAPKPDPESVGYFRADLHALSFGGRTLWLATRTLGHVLIVPIAEELAFRGFLLRRLIAADFSEVDLRRQTPLAVFGSSLAFGLLHPGAQLPGVLAGIAFALAQRSRGRIADAVVAHITSNLLIAIAVLVFGMDWLWV